LEIVQPKEISTRNLNLMKLKSTSASFNQQSFMGVTLLGRNRDSIEKDQMKRKKTMLAGENSELKNNLKSKLKLIMEDRESEQEQLNNRLKRKTTRKETCSSQHLVVKYQK